MTTTIATWAICFIGLALTGFSAALYLHARGALKNKAEREEMARAHRIVMKLAVAYKAGATLDAAKQVSQLRAEVIKYYEDATNPKAAESVSESSVEVIQFSKVRPTRN